MQANDKLIVALDVPTLEEAEEIVSLLVPLVGIFKIGLQLYSSCGPKAVEMVQRYGARVFLDLKLHDIPHTVADAGRVITGLGVGMFTLHVAGGLSMLRAAVQAAREEALARGIPCPMLLGVTLLTSLQVEDVRRIGLGTSVIDVVQRWAGLAREAGLDGVVASPREVRVLRLALGPEFILVCPGIRPAWSGLGDQKRTMTPREAARVGVDYLVVGRPIVEADDPVQAVTRIIQEIEEGLSC